MARGIQWPHEDEAKLRELAGDGLSLRQIAEVMGKTYSQVKNKTAALGVRTLGGVDSPTLTRVVSETPERVVYAAEETDEEPIEHLKERAIRQTSREVAKARARRHVHAKLVTRKPIGIALASDQHLATSGAVDVKKAFADAELIQQEPGLFAMLGGDGVNNAIKHLSSMVAGTSAPNDEWRLYDHYLATMGQKILAVVSGNHDDFSKDISGVDMVARLAARQRLHFAPDEVTVRVQLVASPDDDEGQEYVVKVRHQYRYGSTLNVGNTVKRLYDMGGDPFDVGVVCHHHEAHVESFDRHGKTRWALRPGSYQIQTGYGRRYGFNPGTPTCPVAIFWPDEHRVVCFRDLREGITHLRAARAEYMDVAA